MTMLEVMGYEATKPAVSYLEQAPQSEDNASVPKPEMPTVALKDVFKDWGINDAVSWRSQGSSMAS